jgi:hypothetical protein
MQRPVITIYIFMHCLGASDPPLISSIKWQYINLIWFLIAPEISCATAGWSSVLVYVFVQGEGNFTDNVMKLFIELIYERISSSAF